MLIAAALFAFQAGTAAQAANEENMLEACRARAAKALGIAADAVEVKYQGQRTDKTHAVNGSATVSGQSKTFQCSFERTGSRIVKFVVNSPESGARSSTDAHHEKAATAAGVPAAPEDGGPRNWEVVRRLSLREQPSTRAKIVASHAPGTLLDNLGCQRAEGRVWCDVQKLGGGPRGYAQVESLKPAVAPHGSVATGPDDSALRAGQGKFDATGNIPCAQHKGQPMGQCEFGVARAGGGYATVVVKKPDGRTWLIFFRMGKPIGADTSQADGNAEFSATKKGDLNLIRIGNERYEIPDAVILGG